MTTPQEDEELREKIEEYAERFRLAFVKGEDEYYSGDLADDVESLIKAHSEKVVLEARISELKRHNENHGDCPTNCMGVRIAELQAQLNNLDKQQN